MNLYALSAGVVLALIVVYRLGTREPEKTVLTYAALLATFPIYYWLFASRASQDAALCNELLASVVFLAVAVIAYKRNSIATSLLLALGYMAHAAYDVYHDSLFVNAGVPTWWPEFCGSVDVILGIHIAFVAGSSCRVPLYSEQHADGSNQEC